MKPVARAGPLSGDPPASAATGTGDVRVSTNLPLYRVSASEAVTAVTGCTFRYPSFFGHAENLPQSAEFIWRWELGRRKEMREFLTHMPANTVIFITMAALVLAATLIMLRS
jgi:hypothetical protein